MGKEEFLYVIGIIVAATAAMWVSDGFGNEKVEYNTPVADRLDAKYRPIQTVPTCYEWQDMERRKAMLDGEEYVPPLGQCYR